jgi:hypothetical protein
VNRELLALTVMCTLLFTFIGAAVGCMAMAFLIIAVGHDCLPLFYGLVATGTSCGLLLHTAPLVTSYAARALGRK